MATKRALEVEGDDELMNLNLRVPRRLVAALDEWVRDLNRGRRIRLVTRTDVLRVLAERAAVLRPSLEEVGTPDEPVAVLEDASGRELALAPLPVPAPASLVLPPDDGAEPETWHLVRAHYQRPEPAPLPRPPVRRIGERK
jgi:hypothetical protein